MTTDEASLEVATLSEWGDVAVTRLLGCPCIFSTGNLENTLTRRDMDRGKKRHQGKPFNKKKFRPPVEISSSFSTRKAAFLLKVSFSLKAGVVGNLTINLILALALLFC